jgi:hypothetical protein
VQTSTAPTPVKRATAGFAISLIAGIIILINALVVLSLASFMSSLFDAIGLSFLGTAFTVYGAVGLLFAILVLVGAIVIFMPGKEVIGGILVLIFSILSIIIGGGFIIGLILGIIGGALGLAKK